MKIVESKTLDHPLIIIEKRSEKAQGEAEAKKRDGTLYTRREMQYVLHDLEAMEEEEKQHYIQVVDALKRNFNAFFQVPKDWEPPKHLRGNHEQSKR